MKAANDNHGWEALRFSHCLAYIEGLFTSIDEMDFPDAMDILDRVTEKTEQSIHKIRFENEEIMEELWLQKQAKEKPTP